MPHPCRGGSDGWAQGSHQGSLDRKEAKSSLTKVKDVLVLKFGQEGGQVATGLMLSVAFGLGIVHLGTDLVGRCQRCCCLKNLGLWGRAVPQMTLSQNLLGKSHSSGREHTAGPWPRVCSYLYVLYDSFQTAFLTTNHSKKYILCCNPVHT